MTLHFEAESGAAVDRYHGVEIPPPRLVPLDHPDQTQFEYSIYRNERRHGFACLATDEVFQENGLAIRHFTLHFEEDGTIEWALKLKSWMNIEGDAAAFLQRLAEGVVKVFEKQTANYSSELRYQVITDAAALDRHNLSLPSAKRLPDSRIELAYVRVPLNP